MNYAVMISFEAGTDSTALAFRAAVDALIHRGGTGQAYAVTLHKNTIVQDRQVAPWEIVGDTLVDHT